MARTEDQTRALFNAWAATYDDDLRQASGPLLGYEGSLQAVDAALPTPLDGYMLDIGIGSGTLAKRLAERGATIAGIDISEQMLALCRQQHPYFVLEIGTFNAIPFGDDLFDGVVSGFAFHETSASKRAEACHEMARVLKPGGLLCLLDIMFASRLGMQEAQQLIADQWDDSEDYAIVGELDVLLREQGFTSVAWRQTAPFHWLVTARKV